MISAFLVVMLSAAASPADGDLLEKAQAEARGLKMQAALQTLKAAERLEGLDRAQVLTLFELKGVAMASLGDAEGAQLAFRALLTLDPEAKLKGRVSPKVQTPFSEAKTQARESGGLVLEALPPRGGKGEPLVLQWRVADPLGLVARVSIELSEDGALRQVVLAPRGIVEVPVKGRVVRASVTALSSRGWRLQATTPAEFSDATAPLSAPPLATVETAPPPTPTPVVTPVAQAVVTPAPVTVTTAPGDAAGAPRFRPAMWACAGLAVVALGAGTAFGLDSSSGRAQQSALAVNGDGVVTEMTRTQAQALEKRVQSSALAADVAFGAGAVLGGAAVVLWLVGAPVAAAPTPGGAVVAVQGRF